MPRAWIFRGFINWPRSACRLNCLVPTNPRESELQISWTPVEGVADVSLHRNNLSLKSSPVAVSIFMLINLIRDRRNEGFTLYTLKGFFYLFFAFSPSRRNPLSRTCILHIPRDSSFLRFLPLDVQFSSNSREISCDDFEILDRGQKRNLSPFDNRLWDDFSTLVLFIGFLAWRSRGWIANFACLSFAGKQLDQLVHATWTSAKWNVDHYFTAILDDIPAGEIRGCDLRWEISFSCDCSLRNHFSSSKQQQQQTFYRFHFSLFRGKSFIEKCWLKVLHVLLFFLYFENVI